MVDKTPRQMIELTYYTLVGNPDNPHDNGVIGKVHDIDAKVSEINGSVKLLVQTVFNPDDPESGLASRVGQLEPRVNKLKFWNSIWKMLIFFIIGAIGSQWLEEVFRGSTFEVNTIMRWFMALMGGL